MSDIKVGDLVVVVRPSICIGGNANIGHTFTVRKIDSWLDGGPCKWCNRRHYGAFYAYDDDGESFPLPRLKRIQPMSELEGEKREEDLREPA